jgi:hypothetical protein
VRGGVVEHQVHVQLGLDLCVQRLQELLELDRSVAAVESADHLAGGDVKCRIET